MALHGVRRYLALDRFERWSLLRAYVWLTVIDIVLRIDRRHIVIRRSLVPPTPSLRGDQTRLWGEAQTCARWIEVAARHHFVRARCLHRALVLNFWLRRAGMSSRVRIGVRKQGPVLQAHAWVELNGHMVSENPAVITSFTQLTAFPSSGRLEHCIQDNESRQPADRDLFGGRGRCHG